MNPPFKTRFAPSPTGQLHLGHVYAAIQAFHAAEQLGGECLLRIEDIDHTRCKPAFSKAICDDLAWLGFQWPEPLRTQSQHLGAYAKVITSLQKRQLIYRCFKTRAELPSGLYRGSTLDPELEAQKLAAGIPFAWRLDIERCKQVIKTQIGYEETGLNPGYKTINLDAISDEVLARKDIGTSYHIACCHDDALQNITHIIRGEDIAELTPLHRLLQELMSWPTPIYHHHALLKNKDSKKLSKRNGDLSIAHFRQQGLSPKDVRKLAQKIDM